MYVNKDIPELDDFPERDFELESLICGEQQEIDYDAVEPDIGWIDNDLSDTELINLARFGQTYAIPEKYADTDVRIYRIWCTMKQRCMDPNQKDYPKYGGRGIRVCNEWMSNFRLFYTWAIYNGYTDTFTIDRIDSNGNYEPNNCRWISMAAQQSNRSSNANYTINGETHTLKQWCDIRGANYTRAKKRRQAGWDIERILKPVSEIPALSARYGLR